MATEIEERNIRAKFAGMIMRDYRLSFKSEEGKSSKLSLEAVGTRMSEIDPPRYENVVSSTVYRWETGQTKPNPDHLQVYGQAVGMSQAEIDVLIAIAVIDHGIQPDDADNTPATPSAGTGDQTSVPETPNQVFIPIFVPVPVPSVDQHLQHAAANETLPAPSADLNVHPAIPEEANKDLSRPCRQHSTLTEASNQAPLPRQTPILRY